MKFEEIFNEWKIDSQIDETEISKESLKIPQLHFKYYRWFSAERIILHELNSSLKKLKLEKYEFYSQGHTEETIKKGWELPAKGMILKADIPMYIDADKDIIELSLKIGIQQEKVELLESIIKSLGNRSYLLNTAMDFIRFTNGN